MQIHLWAKRKSPILFGAGLGEIKKRQAGRSGSPKIKKPRTLRNGAGVLKFYLRSFIFSHSAAIKAVSSLLSLLDMSQLSCVMSA